MCIFSCSDVVFCMLIFGFLEIVIFVMVVGNFRSSIVQISSSGFFIEIVSLVQSVIFYFSFCGDWDFGVIMMQELSIMEQESLILMQEYVYFMGMDIYDVEVECYSDYDEVEGCVEFSVDNSFEVMVGFCLEEYVFRFDDLFKCYGYDSGEYWMWVVMGWVENQFGCGEKEIYYLLGDIGEFFNGCFVVFEFIFQDCEGFGYESDEDVYFGGGWVLNIGFGCVLVIYYGIIE